jgi:LysR family transcriptional regulator, low CO2-responsive transcriptional regulator
MTLTQLRTFVAVVDCGSVRAAAERLVVSQPAVSGAVNALERELGVELLTRDGRGIRVTPAGAAFASTVRTGLQHLDHGARAARSTEVPGRGEVRLTAIATAAEHLLLPLLAGFRREHPEARLTVSVGNRDTVWAALRDLEADLVIAGRPPASLPARVLGRADNTLVVVGPPPALRSRRATAGLLRSSTWLLREEGSGTRDACDALLAELDLDPPRMVLGSNGAVEQAVAAGFGVALLPLDAVAGRLAAGEVVRLDCPGTPIERPWHLVASGAIDLTPTAALAARYLLAPSDGFVATAEGRRLLA